VQVIEGLGADCKPKLRAPKRDVTTRMPLHTAGFGYNFFNVHYRRLTQEHGVPGVSSGTIAALKTPRLFDPVDQWEYGSTID